MISSSLLRPLLQLGNSEPAKLLFVHVDSDVSITEIVKMEWDHKITESKEEPKKIGLESRITPQVCEASILNASDLIKAVDMQNTFNEMIMCLMIKGHSSAPEPGTR